MMINQYVGELVDTDVAALTKGIKEDARKAHLATDNIKVNFNDKEGLTVLCTGDVANLIRRRKDVRMFRCNIVCFNEKKEKGKDKDD